MTSKRVQVTVASAVAIVVSLVYVLAASPVKGNCPDDQDGTCDLHVHDITAVHASLLSGWVETGTLYGKSAVHAGSADQTSLTGDGLFANLISVGTVFTNELYASFKSFRIDNPLDPANKYLNHWSVESSEMKNIYDGVVTLDAKGTALVGMPRWFDGLNGDFRYQLTAVGAPAANLYIAKEISGGQFKIAGGKPGLKVSWQVTGVRHDAAARNNHVPIEEEKPTGERGKYLDPAAFGKPASMAVSQRGRVSRTATNQAIALTR
jgi:hypothetical protein